MNHISSNIQSEIKESFHVSIIVPIYNGEIWIDRCFSSIFEQTARNKINIEICICNDASTDSTNNLLKKWDRIFKENNMPTKIFENNTGSPKGVGYGKNRAVEISEGSYLCFQDIDDVMLPDRILKQFELAISLPDTVLIGSKYIREPKDSTLRYTNWANSLTQKQLNEQIYTSNGPTIIMPTWFCHRNVFKRIGGFSEKGKGTPEDLIFFYQHLEHDGSIARVDECLLIYQYHETATTFSIHEQTIWDLRIQKLEKNVLSKWKEFTIWNAGKQGRKFYKSLQPENQNKVIAFCDVDKNKIGKYYIPFDEKTRTTGRNIKMVDFKNAKRPFIICIKQDMTEGIFEDNLKSLKLTEGTDYIYFS